MKGYVKVAQGCSLFLWAAYIAIPSASADVGYHWLTKRSDEFTSFFTSGRTASNVEEARPVLVAKQVDAVQEQSFVPLFTGIQCSQGQEIISGSSAMRETSGATSHTDLYQSSFNIGAGWLGELRKISKRRLGLSEQRTLVWSASQQLPEHSARNILIAGSSATRLQAFSVHNAGLETHPHSLAFHLSYNPEPGVQQATWQQRLAYIRGDQSYEGAASGQLRSRSGMLGDFMNSQPVLVAGARYLPGFANRLEGSSAYTDFAQNMQERSEMLYIGSNGGMLHGFDSRTGVERFAFIPTGVFPTLSQLTAQSYAHRYYVDGTPVVADVYDGHRWRTILVGTLAAGGKGLFALDITDPMQIKLLWEMDEQAPQLQQSKVKLGYSFARPSIARLHHGRWAVVVGNGYYAAGSETGAAALYIIDALQGTLIKSLQVQSPSRSANGLSTARLADYNADGVADYAYAGDLQGNLWRFDLLGDGAQPAASMSGLMNFGSKNGSANNFKVSYGGQPLFRAETAHGSRPQAITAAPSIIRHPSGMGYVVVFGTGRYISQSDHIDSSVVNTVYGVWDLNTQAEFGGLGNVDRGQLQEQKLSRSMQNKSGKTRVLSLHPVEWYKDFDTDNAVKQRGWWFDLSSGERVVSPMQNVGSMLLLQTLVPSDDPCASAATGWLYAIDPVTGGRMQHHVFVEPESAGEAELKEVVSAIEFAGTAQLTLVANENGIRVHAADEDALVQLPPTAQGRQTWRRAIHE